MSIIVLGTLALDTVKTPQETRRSILGGSAAHFSMAARLFTGVELVTVIGEDFPKKHVEFLRKKGIKLASVVVSPGATFRWHGEYRGSLNEAITLSTELGVLAVFKPKISEAQKYIKNIFLANLDPDIQMHVLRHMHSPKLIGLDSMNYWIKNKRRSLLKLMKKVDIYLANEKEAQELSGEHNLFKAARALKKTGPRMAIIKKGEHGVLIYGDKFIFSLPGYPVRRLVDPTGAGDTFAGGFMGYLAKSGNLKENNIRKAIAYGVACSSFNVEGFGLEKTSRLTLADIYKRTSELRRIVYF